MISAELHLARSPEAALIKKRLKAIGIALLYCDQSGHLEAVQEKKTTDDLLANLLLRSPLISAGMKKAAGNWADETSPAPFEIVPGLWMCATPCDVRRRRVGYFVAAIATSELIDSEHLAALCQAAECDVTYANQMIAALPPAAVRDIPRLAELVRLGHEDQLKLISENNSTESLGQQLADSYEEISLLYTIIQNMTLRERPEHFVRTACDELLQTLPYRWIAVQMADDSQLLKHLSGRLFLSGDARISEDEMLSYIRPLVGQTQSNSPRVLDPKFNPDDAIYHGLGQPVMVNPIIADNTVIGLILAGDKNGDDPAVSSVDQKLLGATASHMAIFLENASLVSDLNSMFLGTLEALTASIDAKDRYTCGHSRRVALLTKQLANAIGLDVHTVERMHIAGLVHDVGKIGVPESVLLKPGRLNDAEFEWIRKHPEIGYRILRDIPQLEDILPGVLYHHERWDGRGYPHGLDQERIPLVARLIALADSFDAMSSTRTYRPAMSHQNVIDEILKCSGTQFDPGLVNYFINLDFSEYDRRVNEAQKEEEQGTYVPLTELREFSTGYSEKGEENEIEL